MLMKNSLVAGVYEQVQDRESAYEILKGNITAHAEGAATPATPGTVSSGGMMGAVSDLLFGTTGPRGGKNDGIAQMVVKSAVRTAGSAIGREIVRGVLGSLLGGSKRRR